MSFDSVFHLPTWQPLLDIVAATAADGLLLLMVVSLPPPPASEDAIFTSLLVIRSKSSAEFTFYMVGIRFVRNVISIVFKYGPNLDSYLQ